MSKVLVIKGAAFAANALDTVQFDVIRCTGITLDKTTLNLTAIGAVATLVPTVQPSNCEESIYWTSSNADCCTVTQNGVVTVVGVGTTTIVARCGNYAATCAVAVEIEANVQRQKNGAADAPNASNNFTKFEAFDSTQSWQSTRMVMYINQQTADDLIVGYGFSVIVDSVATLPSWEDSTNTYVQNCKAAGMTGYPMPIRLPAGCTTVRTETSLTGYGSRVLWFKKDVRASDSPSSGGDTTKMSYFSAYRLLAPTNANYSWDYNGGESFTVPDGCDSCLVVWQSGSGVTSFKDMADEDVAKFKMYFS